MNYIHTDMLRIRDLAFLLHEALSDSSGVTSEMQGALVWLAGDIMKTANSHKEQPATAIEQPAFSCAVMSASPLPELDLSTLDIGDLATIWRQLDEIFHTFERIVEEGPCTRLIPGESLSELSPVGKTLDPVLRWILKQRWRIPGELRTRSPSNALEREDRATVMLDAAVHGGESPDVVAALAASLACEHAKAQREDRKGLKP